MNLDDQKQMASNTDKTITEEKFETIGAENDRTKRQNHISAQADSSRERGIRP
jgi:hypothetical protein